MKLAENQVDLLRALKVTGKKIVAVIAGGSAVEIDFDRYCDAILHGYLFGQAGAGAVLNILTGKVSPSGKLAESYPFNYTDCSSSSNFPHSFHCDETDSRNVEYREGIFVGYRYYDTAGVAVKYPFGFGLSYTTFEYSNIKVDAKGATFTIKNTGETAGSEVAQLYIGLKDSKIFRAKKELKGFTKVFLEAGASKTVTIPFDEYSFRYFNVETNKWEVEGGKYQIMVSSSSLDSDIKLSAELEQKATTDKLPYQGLNIPSYKSGKVADVSKDEFEVLYGKALPDPAYPYINKKKNRIRVNYNTGIQEMRFAKGCFGRFFAWSIRFADKMLWAMGMKKMSNMLKLNFYNLPMRGFVRFGIMSTARLDGFIKMCNGEWGLFPFLFPKKRKKLCKKGEEKK